MTEIKVNHKAMRRIYLIKRKLQMKYALMIGAVLAGAMALMQAHTFLLIQGTQLTTVDPLLVEALKSLRMWMLASGLVYVIVIPLLSIFISHKIAGPLFRFERTLEQAIENKGPIPPIRLRDGDELQEMAELINKLLERVQTPPPSH